MSPTFQASTSDRERSRGPMRITSGPAASTCSRGVATPVHATVAETKKRRRLLRSPDGLNHLGGGFHTRQRAPGSCAARPSLRHLLLFPCPDRRLCFCLWLSIFVYFPPTDFSICAAISSGLALGSALVLSAFGSASRPSDFDAHFPISSPNACTNSLHQTSRHAAAKLPQHASADQPRIRGSTTPFASLKILQIRRLHFPICSARCNQYALQGLS